MHQVLELARRAGASDAKVLITGESGVGKELVAREIHEASSRNARPCLAVNCAGVPESLLESELFGFVRGSFTGADRDRAGKLKQADGGTLFLDEVGEMSLRMQALLLRFADSGEIQTVGESPQLLDVRVISATNRNLPERVAAGEFRLDLLYRLSGIQIVVPPLRERRYDIPVLVEHFLERSPRPLTCSAEAMDVLLRYPWPGNVRELQNVIEQAIWLAAGRTITLADLPDALRMNERDLVASRERRRQVADQLFEGLTGNQYSFWEDVYPLFIGRDLTRHDIRELVRRGLSVTNGNYRALVTLFGMSNADYFRFHNFLTAHRCKVDFRAYRQAGGAVPMRRPELPLDA